MEYRVTDEEDAAARRVAARLRLPVATFIRLAVLRRLFAPQSRPRDDFRRWLKEENARARASAHERARNARLQQHRRRAWLTGAFVEDVDLDTLFARDRGICGICHLPVPRADATIDHIVPLSKGGPHSYANTQVAHAICNSRKGSRLDFSTEK